jgi:hypothetical protein
LTDAVEKGFLTLERRRAFQKRAHMEKVDSRTPHFGVYCPFPAVGRSWIDFFDSIDPKRQFATVIRSIAKGFSGLRVGLAKPSGHILRLAASFRSALN